MEKEINIAAILKDKPKGIQLFDLLHCVKVKLDRIEFVKNNKQEAIIWCDVLNSNKITLFNYSHTGTEVGWLNGLQILKPSHEMRDWSKFAWKKGNVLKNKDGILCMFSNWYDSYEYTTFHARFMERTQSDPYLEKDKVNRTECWDKVTDANVITGYISKIEKTNGGKLNLETLEIEKPQFKDGDIIKHGKNIYIVQNFTDSYIRIYAGLIGNTGEVITRRLGISSNFGCSNLTTDSEKQQLFAALEKEGKRWNAETKTLEDLPKKCEFKPFDKVMVRNYDS